MTDSAIWCIMGKREGGTPMLKKLTSLLLSFLLCLSLLPGHAYAAKESDLPQPPVIEEPLGPEPPEEPVMVMSEEVGQKEENHLL